MRDHRQSIVFLTVIGVFLHHFLNYELLDKLRAAFLKNVDLMQLDEIMGSISSKKLSESYNFWSTFSGSTHSLI